MSFSGGGELALNMAAAAIAFCVAWKVGGLTRSVMLRLQILDVPNQRSSHRKPTPSLGGLGIISGFWCGLSFLLLFGGRDIVPTGVLLALGGAHIVLLPAAMDDLGRPLKVAEKMLLQLMAVGIWLFFGPQLESLALPFVGQVVLGGWGWALTAIWFVWLSNIYNFMDGIDGITAFETIIVCGFLAFLFWNIGSGVWSVCLMLLAATGGFLILNFPPASIFMGDVGSIFLGVTIAGLGVLGVKEGIPFWGTVLLLGYYLCDSGYTLARRVLNGENVLQPHRTHLYQRLNELGWSHLQIDLGVAVIGLLLGGSLCSWVFLEPVWAWVLGGVAGVSLIAGAIWVERRHCGLGSPELTGEGDSPPHHCTECRSQ